MNIQQPTSSSSSSWTPNSSSTTTTAASANPATTTQAVSRGPPITPTPLQYPQQVLIPSNVGGLPPQMLHSNQPSRQPMLQQQQQPSFFLSRSVEHQQHRMPHLGGPLLPLPSAGVAQQSANRPLMPGMYNAGMPRLQQQQQFSFTPNGDRYPIALTPYLDKGKPMKLAQVCQDKDLDFFVAKFPEGFDLKDLAPPIVAQRLSTEEVSCCCCLLSDGTESDKWGEKDWNERKTASMMLLDTGCGSSVFVFVAIVVVV